MPGVLCPRLISVKRLPPQTRKAAKPNRMTLVVASSSLFDDSDNRMTIVSIRRWDWFDTAKAAPKKAIQRSVLRAVSSAQENVPKPP